MPCLRIFFVLFIEKPIYHCTLPLNLSNGAVEYVSSHIQQNIKYSSSDRKKVCMTKESKIEVAVVLKQANSKGGSVLDSKAWFSLNRNSSPIIVLEHRRSSAML